MLTRRTFLTSLGATPFAAKLLHAREWTQREADTAESISNGYLNYYPRGMYVWDSWYFTHGEEIHVIHLQKKRPGSDRSEVDGRSLGHAVSADFLTWKELPMALIPGPEGSIDDLDLFTGCTHFHNGTYYLYYTARKKSEQGQFQRLCVSTSKDAIHWTKHADPVIEPDERWYQQGDCRDLMVVKDPETPQFHGFFTARIHSTELTQTAVVAHATSRDLIEWKQGPPVFTPNAFGILEEPDVFELNGRWWIICATGNFDGVRGEYHDPYVTYGTVYASSERIDGPYVMGSKNLLLGSMKFNGFSCRTVQWKGERFVMYTQAERRNNQDSAPTTLGSLSTPKKVMFLSDGQLCPVYSPLIESRIESVLIDDHVQLQEVPFERAARRFGTSGNWTLSDDRVRASSLKSWSVRRCGPESDSFIWSAQVRLDSGRAMGLLFRESLAVYLDFSEQCVTFTELPRLERLEARSINLEHRRDYRLRIIAKSEFFEAYVDDILLLNFVHYQPQRGRFGLYIEAGEGSFSALKAVSIRS